MSLLPNTRERIARGSAIIGVALILVGFSTLSAKADARVEYRPIGQPNQCLADAVGFQTSLQVQYPGVWSRILKVNWNVRVGGQYSAHAYCIYEINHQLYAYDSRSGQRRLDLAPSAKFHPEVLGSYLGRRYYASAKYLSAFDPIRIGMSGTPALPAGQPLASLAQAN